MLDILTGQSDSGRGEDEHGQINCFQYILPSEKLNRIWARRGLWGTVTEWTFWTQMTFVYLSGCLAAKSPVWFNLLQSLDGANMWSCSLVQPIAFTKYGGVCDRVNFLNSDDLCVLKWLFSCNIPSLVYSLIEPTIGSLIVSQRLFRGRPLPIWGWWKKQEQENEAPQEKLNCVQYILPVEKLNQGRITFLILLIRWLTFVVL